jgi:hypothetical protein
VVASALHSDGVQVYSSSTTQTASSTFTADWTGQANTPVVEWAEKMAPHLQHCGDEDYMQCYDASFPAQVLTYWQSSCSGSCSVLWSNGDLQCVLFVTGAYGAAGQSLPYAPDAVYFWQDYANLAGWTEYANGTALPEPGDIIVWQDGSGAYPGSGAGHVAIVTDVQAPTATQTGFVQFAQGNSYDAVDTQPIDNSDVLHTWQNFTVLGYIRHTS